MDLRQKLHNQFGLVGGGSGSVVSLGLAIENLEDCHFKFQKQRQHAKSYIRDCSIVGRTGS